MIVQSAPIAGPAAPVEMTIARSAAGVTVTERPTVLFDESGSAFSPWIEKLVVSVPAAAAWGQRTTVTVVGCARRERSEIGRENSVLHRRHRRRRSGRPKPRATSAGNRAGHDRVGLWSGP